jgi:hypothetical protein
VAAFLLGQSSGRAATKSKNPSDRLVVMNIERITAESSEALEMCLS